MKPRRTKQVLFLGRALSGVLIVAFPMLTLASLESDLQNKQEQLNSAQNASQNKAAEAKNITTQVSNLDSDIKSTESKIQQTGTKIQEVQSSIDKLSSDIDVKKKDLAELKKKLNGLIVELYRFSSRSQLESLLLSDKLSETANEQDYVAAVQMQVTHIFSQVDSAKTDLEKQKSDQEAQKAELDQLKKQQEDYQSSSQYQMTQKNKLLGMTVEQKAAYDVQATKLKSEITQISAQIYAERQARLSGGRETLGGGGSGYPYSSIDEPDAWGFLTRECTSYAAWYLNVVRGTRFVNTRPGSGSAYNWANLARDQGLTVSGSPRVGAVISWGAGPLTSGWGHVAAVEAINGDGTIDISEYNWIRYAYSYRRNVSPGDYGSYSYIY